MEDLWLPFMGRAAILVNPSAADPEELRAFETEFQRLVEKEGGRVLGLFWHYAFPELGDAGTVHLIGIFEARDQYPVSRGRDVSLEKYVRAPEVAENETPESLDAETMADSIRRSLDQSGRFLVTELQRWRRADEFHAADNGESTVEGIGTGMWARVVGEEGQSGESSG